MTNSEKDELKTKFFQLRAIDGKSLRQIEAELGVTKKTLCSWHKEMQNQIGACNDFKLEELSKKYKFTESHKLELKGELYTKVCVELSTREIKDISTEKLFSIMLTLQDKLIALPAVRTGEKDFLAFSSRDNAERINI